MPVCVFMWVYAPRHSKARFPPGRRGEDTRAKLAGYWHAGLTGKNEMEITELDWFDQTLIKHISSPLASVETGPQHVTFTYRISGLGLEVEII